MARPPRGTIFDDPLTRTASVPLVLWLCAAAVVHYAGGTGAVKVAQVVEDRDELRAAVRIARQGLRPSDTTFEVLTDDAKVEPQKTAPPKDDGPPDPKAEASDPDPDAPKPEVAPKPPPAPKEPEKKKDPPKPEPPKVAEKPPEPKPAPPKPLVPVLPQPAAPPPPPPPPPEMDHRQAVKQHVKKDQPDNPNANRIADDANHTDKETQARNRVQDQDSPKPSMAASKGPKEDQGTGDKDDHSGSIEDKKGNERKAPGEAKPAATDAQHERPAPPVPPAPKSAPPPSIPGVAGKGGKGAAPAPAAPPPSPGGAGPASPEVVAGDKGGYTLDPANPGGDGTSKNPGKKRPALPFHSPVNVGALGLGGAGLPGGPNLNLNMAQAEKAIGNEQLARERAADGAARRAAHRGGFEKNKFDKYRPAIENYEPLVQLDNTTSLNAARSPFATYLTTIHNRIHPIFAEEFLEFLNGLPKGHTLNDMELKTHVEMVLDKTSGKVIRMGITRPSGNTAFDVAALSSIDRAGPFGKAPDIIASPDGNVYLHWEFHRDPVDACTTRNARPFLLKEAPKKPSAPVGPLRRPGGGSRDEKSPPSGPLLPIRGK